MMFGYFSSVRARLFSLVLLVVIPALGLFAYTGMEERRMAAYDAHLDALRLVRLAAAQQQEQVENARQFLTVLSRLPSVLSGDAGAIETDFANFLKVRPGASQLFVADAQGNVIAGSSPVQNPVNVSDRSYFQRAMETRGFAIGDYQVGRITGKPAVNFAYPVTEEDGRVMKVVFAAVDLVRLNKLAAGYDLPPESSFQLMDRNGVILVRYPDSARFVGTRVQDAALVEKMARDRDEGVVQAVGRDGVERLYAFAPVMSGKELAFSVSVGISTEVAFALENQIFLRNMTVLCAVLLLMIGITRVFGTKFIVRPVLNLVGATQRLEAGDLAARTRMSYAVGEFGKLARAFDEMADALQKRQIEAEQAQRLKDELMNILAHELRIPVTAIEQSLSLFTDGSLGAVSDKQKHFLDLTVRQVERLEKLVAKVVLATQVLTGKIGYAAQPVDVGALLEGLEKKFRPTAESKGVQFARITPDKALFCSADRKHLEEALAEIVDNAVGVTPQGGKVEILSLLREDGVEISVRDTGPGIPPQAQSAIFEAFRSVGGINERKTGGLGLGLFIAKSLIEGQHGTLAVESAEGKGVRMTVVVPFAKEKAA